MKIIIYLIALLSILASVTNADNAFIKLPTNYLYVPPPTIELSEKERKRLKKGKRIYKQVTEKDQTQQVVIFRVDASKDKIWQTILNYSSYPDWIKNVDHTQLYREEDQHYYVDFLVGHWLLGKFRYSVVHYLSNDSWMKWRLDDKKPADFTLSIGYWKVIEASNDTGKHDVYYSANFQFREPRPEYIRKKGIKAGLKQASIWLPREAQK